MSHLSMELPETLHQRLETLAKNEGISLNQYVLSTLTRHATAAYTVRATSESVVEKQRADFATLLENLGQASFSEIAKTLQERETVAPEPGLTPEVVARLQKLINERLTSEERLMMETVS